MVRAVQETMKNQGAGVIVNVASTAGLNGIGSSIAYCASKAALLNISKSLARVLGPEVRINSVCPGFIQGDWLKEGLGEGTYEKIKTKTELQTQLKKTTTAQNIAEAIKRTPNVKILIIGNADYRGSEKLNEKLALERAQAVKNVLVESFGVDASILEIQSNGEKVPIAKGTDPMALQANRRVQFFIIE